MAEYNEMWMIVGTWWTQADMAESWWRSGGLHAQWDCGPYSRWHHEDAWKIMDAALYLFEAVATHSGTLAVRLILSVDCA